MDYYVCSRSIALYNHYSQMVGLYVDPEGKTIRTCGLSYTNEQIISDLISEDDAMKGLRLRITELERTLQQYKVTWLVCMYCNPTS